MLKDDLENSAFSDSHPQYLSMDACCMCSFLGEMGSLGVCVTGWERENDKVCLHVPGRGHRNEISRSHAKKDIPLTYFRADA